MEDGRLELTRLVQAQAGETEAWQVAELHLLEQAFRDRLAAVGVEPSPEVAVALMAAATLLGEHAPEWGGNVRCSLNELALLALRLLEDDAG